jgi:hypothetical protein
MMARMSRAELALFTAFLRRSRRYVEFGTGGSTCTASNCVAELIISVDSSREWLNKVYAHCDGIKPRLVHIDIGETVQWGYPKDDNMRESWPRYHSAVWDDPDSKTADLYLIDGRFRVACFLQVLLRNPRRVPIIMHDYTTRRQYHVVSQFADEIAQVEDISVFLRRDDVDHDLLIRTINEYLYNPQ